MERFSTEEGIASSSFLESKNVGLRTAYNLNSLIKITKVFKTRIKFLIKSHTSVTKQAINANGLY